MTRRTHGGGRRGVVHGFPTAPGWWIQWTAGGIWFPVAADFAAWVRPQLVDGDRLVKIERQRKVA